MRWILLLVLLFVLSTVGWYLFVKLRWLVFGLLGIIDPSGRPYAIVPGDLMILFVLGLPLVWIGAAYGWWRRVRK